MQSIDILTGCVLDLMVCTLVCRIVHDCQQLDKPRHTWLDSSASDDTKEIDSGESDPDVDFSFRRSIRVERDSNYSKVEIEAEICVAQWFQNEIELDLTEEDDTDLNPTGDSQKHYLNSEVSLNYDDE